MNESKTECRVLVAQNGARHGYAVPRVLAEHNILAGFYTDACASEGLGKLIAKLPFLRGVDSVAKLQARQIPECVRSKTRSFPLSSFLDSKSTRGFYGASSACVDFEMKLNGFQGANMIYSSLGWGKGFLKHASERGLDVVTEYYVNPSLWRVQKREQNLFPDWHPEPPMEPAKQQTEEQRLGCCLYSKALVVPSNHVRDSLLEESLFEAEKIYIIPYGVERHFADVINKPAVGTVGFVGSCTLFKGIHYLSKATNEMSSEARSRLKFIAAGDVDPSISGHPEAKHLNFLGRIPRNEMRDVYEKMDVLVFPTLSDSFGAVMLEAMAAGIPVICSPYCGSVVEHGVEGYIVEPRDTQALAESIVKITEDRHLREQMSVAARKKAEQYTWERFGSKLVNTLEQIIR